MSGLSPRETMEEALAGARMRATGTAIFAEACLEALPRLSCVLPHHIQEADAVQRIIPSLRGRRAAWLVLPGLLALLLAAGAPAASPVTAQPIGTLIVQKQLVDASGAQAQGDLSGYTFVVTGAGTSVTVGPTNAQGQATIGLAPGTYSITENQKAGATILGFFLGGVQVGNFAITAGQTTTLIARNQVAGNSSIQFTKQIVDASGNVLTGVDRSGFQFTITGSNGSTQSVTTDTNGSAVVSNLAAATYSITETPKSGFTFHAMTINGVTVQNGGSFNLSTGQIASIIVQNRQGAVASPNSVRIEKQVIDATGAQVTGASRANFMFTLTCGTSYSQSGATDASGVVTFNNVPAVTCTLTETVTSGFTFDGAFVGGSATNIGNPGQFVQVSGAATSILVRNRQSGTSGGATESVPLVNGCNNVTSTFPSGTAASTVAAGVSPGTGLIAMWKFDNAAQRFQGYSPIPNAPNDLTALGRFDPVFICMNGAGNFNRPVA